MTRRMAFGLAAVTVALPGVLLCKAAGVLIRWATWPDT